MLSNSIKCNYRRVYGLRKYSSQSNVQHERKPLSSENIRNIFLDYFTLKQQHQFIRSSSVVPFSDGTVPFVVAGMHQVFRSKLFQLCANSLTSNFAFSSKIFFWTKQSHRVRQRWIHRNVFESVANTMIWMWSAPMAIITRFSKCWGIGRSGIISRWIECPLYVLHLIF